MGGLGDHVGEIIYILLGIIFIVAVMVIATGLNKTSKKSTNQKVNELNQQVAAVDDQFFEEWDQSKASGAQVKQLIKNAKNQDCAILIGTLGLFGNEPKWTGVTATLKDGSTGTNSAETTFNGTALSDAYTSQLPAVKVSLADANNPHKTTDGTFVVKTALDSRIKSPVLINYGSILKNAVVTSGVDSEKYTSILTATAGSGGAGTVGTVTVNSKSWDDTVDTAQEIAYADGRFVTKSEFAVSQSGQVLRYDSTLDWNSSGKTMTIADGAQYNTYVLVNAAGKYMGIVCIETH